MQNHSTLLVGSLAVLLASCSSAAPNRTNGMGGEGGEAGADGTGGSGGKAPGTGGRETGGAVGTGGAVSTGGSEQTGGSTGTPDASSGSGGQGMAMDASMSGGTPDAGPVGPSPSGQGPNAEGTIVFSRDFEDNSMAGLSRSPNGLPEDRIQIEDDPTKQRGKVMRITYKAGDSFQTSGGTQPRSWLSSAMGYTVKPGKTVSVAFGFMTDNPNWGAHFAQIIRDGGPLWMLLLDTGGGVASEVHRGSGGGKSATKIEAMKWYDFRIDTTYSGGGAIKFYMNGQPIGSGTGNAGPDGRFDCGIYWYNGSKATRNAWISNISIGEK
jgi:hypothetical protein